ncbi:uncharacterized protein [Apostichopus japonicus]|uniref:uncharacterized protein isoform X3 n=1 Tax=Stichopus japonicus TaxID=307972 RepID=UPI003AB7763C
MDGTDGSRTGMNVNTKLFPGFGAFKLHVSKQLTSSVIDDLATYFEFEPVLCEKVKGNGLEFVNTLVETGQITEDDISKLLEALEKSGLGGKKSNIQSAFKRYRKDATQDSCYTPSVANVSCKESLLKHGLEESNYIPTIMDLSSNPQNIEVKCSICKDYFTEPKRLSCFHRFCKGCLTKEVQVPNGKHLKCPTCSHTCSIPDKGLDGFKTDYHMENLVEFQKIKSAFNGKAINDCFACSEKSVHMAGFCFKCKNFLCDKCYQLHLTNKSIRDHKEKVISAKDCASDGFDLQKYLFLKEPQKCDVHDELTVDLCCSTCNNLPVCFKCATVDHVRHNTCDMKSLAAKEKEKLNEVKEHIEKCNEKCKELIKGIKETNARVEAMYDPAAQKTKDQHEREMLAMVDKTREKAKDCLKKSKDKLDQSLQKQEASIREDRKKEIRKINEKYDNKLEEIHKGDKEERETLDKNHNITLQKLSSERKQIEKKMEKKNDDAKQEQEKKVAKVSEISVVVNQLAVRMCNYNATSESIRHADDDRITIQCLPELHIECKRLADEFEKESFELASILSIKSVRVIKIDAMKGTKQKIQSITSCGKNRIAITGYESRYNSFLAIIDSEGEQKQFTTIEGKKCGPKCFIASLSDAKVVIASNLNLITIFNTQDLSILFKEDISRIIPLWVYTWRISCVATDRDTEQIYVGASNLNIYVFNEHLTHVQTLDLTKIVKSIADILILERDLLVCDVIAKSACIVTRQGGLSVLKHEIENIGRNEYCPLNACTDKEGCIFMLWSKKQGDVDCSFAKYSQDGRSLISTGSLDKRKECVTIMEQSEGKESLVAASGKSNKMFLYTLPRSTNPHTQDAHSKKPVEKVIHQSEYNRPENKATSALRVSDKGASTSGYSSTQKPMQPGTTQTEAKVSRSFPPKEQVLQDSDIANKDIGTTYCKSGDIKQQGNKENSLDCGKSSQAIKRPFPASSNRSSLTLSSARNTDVKKIKKGDATSSISNMPAQRLSGEPVYLSQTEVRKQQGNREKSLMGGKSSQAPERAYLTAANRSPLSSRSARNTDVKKNKKGDATSSIPNMPAQRLSGGPVNLSR